METNTDLWMSFNILPNMLDKPGIWLVKLVNWTFSPILWCLIAMVILDSKTCNSI